MFCAELFSSLTLGGLSQMGNLENLHRFVIELFERQSSTESSLMDISPLFLCLLFALYYYFNLNTVLTSPETSRSISSVRDNLTVARAFSVCLSRHKWTLSVAVLRNLHKSAMLAPRNNLTGTRQLMVALVGGKYFILTLNFICSARSVGLDPHFLLIVALDQSAYVQLSPVYSNIILADISQLMPQYYDLRRINHLIAEFLLDEGVEVSLIDSDVIFLGNPQPLLSRLIVDTDVVLSLATANGGMTRNICVGVMTLAPTAIGKALLKQWMVIFEGLRRTRLPAYQDSLLRALDQFRFPKRVTFQPKWNFTPQWANDVIRGCSISWSDVQTLCGVPSIKTRAAERVILKPVILHLACSYPIGAKLASIHRLNLNFTRGNDCRIGNK
jgi:hypothetical protein